MKAAMTCSIFSWLWLVLCLPQWVTGQYSFVQGPGTQVAWNEAGIILTVPEGFVARKDRSHAVLELFSEEDVSLTDLQTTILRNNQTEMLANGIVGMVSTFCLTPGFSATSLQELLQTVPYYLLDSNSTVADILFGDQNAVIHSADLAQGVFRSNSTDNMALVTLMVNKLEAFGVSIVLVSQTVDTDALQNATSNIVYGLSVVEPQIPLTVGNDSLSWTEYMNDQRLSVTSVAARPLSSYFDAYANGSCTAVMQGASQRSGTWSVAGTCLNETSLFGNVYHALGLERTTGGITFGSQRWSIGQGIPAVSAGGESTQNNTAASSPCTFTQPTGSVVAPGSCHDVCILANGSAAPPTQPCTIGAPPDTVCTTCASVYGNLFIIDTSALPARTNTTYIDICGANCPYVEYLDMLQSMPEQLCNSTCAANELNWAASKLSQPVNSSACSSNCEQQHEEFMARSQPASMLTPTSEDTLSTTPRRQLLQNMDCYDCWLVDFCENGAFPVPSACIQYSFGILPPCGSPEAEAEIEGYPDSNCPAQHVYPPPPPPPEETPPCWDGLPDCGTCPDPASQHPEVACWYGVYVDNSGTPDSRWCTNCAQRAMDSAAEYAREHPSTSSRGLNSQQIGNVVIGALQVAIALG